MEINAYNKTYNVKSPNSQPNSVLKGDSSLGMDDFLNLLAAQMTNQDAMNPMENTEFVSQLAQFSSLQAMTNLAETSKQSQATSFVGKNVVMASYNKKGELVTDEGIVEKVTLHSGETKIYLHGNSYDIGNIMEIKADSSSTVVEETLGKILKEITNINSTIITETKE